MLLFSETVNLDFIVVMSSFAEMWSSDSNRFENLPTKKRLTIRCAFVFFMTILTIALLPLCSLSEY